MPRIFRLVFTRFLAFCLLVSLPGYAQPSGRWAQQLGGSGSDLGADVAVDDAGNVYVTGSLQYTAQIGSVTLTSPGGPYDNAYVAKFDAQGALVWARQALGNGLSSSGGGSVAVDGAGNVYVTGRFTGPLAFGLLSTRQSANGSDAFLVKFDNQGTAQWLQQADRPGGIGEGVAVSPTGDVCVAGVFAASSAGAAVFVHQYDAQGGLVWSQTAAGNSEVRATTAVALDATGNVFVAGNRATDVFLHKYSPLGALVWARSGGGPGRDGAGSLAVDASGNAYLAGYFLAQATFGGVGLASQGGGNDQDTFLVKYDPLGAVLWARNVGSEYHDVSGAVALDAGGNPYVSGDFSGTLVFGGTALPTAGSSDVFVAKFTPQGTPQWALRDGGPEAEYCRSLAVRGTGEPFVAGDFYFQRSSLAGQAFVGRGNGDAFVARLGSVLATRTADGLARTAVLGVYPNPARGEAAPQLLAPPRRTPQEVEVLNGLGQVVRRQTLPAGSQALVLHTAGLLPGAYVVRVAGVTGRLLID